MSLRYCISSIWSTRNLSRWWSKTSLKISYNLSSSSFLKFSSKCFQRVLIISNSKSLNPIFSRLSAVFLSNLILNSLISVSKNSILVCFRFFASLIFTLIIKSILSLRSFLVFWTNSFFRFSSTSLAIISSLFL